MKNIHFYLVSARGFNQEAVSKMVLRDPEGGTMSSFGVHAKEGEPMVSSYDVSGLKLGELPMSLASVIKFESAKRDIPKSVLNAAVEKKVNELKEGRDGVAVSRKERGLITEEVTLELAPSAPIVRKISTVIAYSWLPGWSVLAVEAGSRDDARSLAVFASRCMNADGDEPVRSVQLTVIAQEPTSAVMRSLVKDPSYILTVDESEDLYVGDGCQIQDSESKTMFTVRSGDLGSDEVLALMEPPTREVKKVRLVLRDFEDGGDYMGNPAEFNLTPDGGLKSVKWGDVLFERAMDHGTDDANTYLICAYVAKAFRAVSSLLQVDPDELEGNA